MTIPPPPRWLIAVLIDSLCIAGLIYGVNKFLIPAVGFETAVIVLLVMNWWKGDK